jgi:hypothetical protein
MQPFRPAAEPPGNAFSCSSTTPFAQTILFTTYRRRNTAQPEKLPLKQTKALLPLASKAF